MQFIKKAGILFTLLSGMAVMASAQQDTTRLAPKTHTGDSVKTPPKKYRIIKKDPSIFQSVGEPDRMPKEPPADTLKGRKPE
jgi:hypothetical protein